MPKTMPFAVLFRDRDVEKYLSLIDADLHSGLINQALREYMQNSAQLYLSDGTEPVLFWKLLNREKNEVLRCLGLSRDSPIDAELWLLVKETTTKDFYFDAARYLTLHELKHGEPYRLPLVVPAPARGDSIEELRRKR